MEEGTAFQAEGSKGGGPEAVPGTWGGQTARTERRSVQRDRQARPLGLSPQARLAFGG